MATDMEVEKLQREDHDRLVRLEGKIDTFIALQNDTKLEMSDHEARIRVMENINQNLRGSLDSARVVFGVVAALIGIVEPFILFYVAKG